MRALESHGYSLAVGWLPGHVSLRLPLKLVATRLQHSMHSLKKKKPNILDKIMPQMFKAMQKIAEFLCNYIKCGRFSRWFHFWFLQILMIAERAGDALIYLRDKEMLEEMDRELANVIKDFLHAVNVEALCLAKMTGKYHCINIAQIHSQ